jgi:lysozyme family protein
MHRVKWMSLGEALQAIERYNGLGYQKYHPDTPSPYLWAGTTAYARGKYVADRKWSEVAVDRQLGCAAILKRMEERGIIYVGS